MFVEISEVHISVNFYFCLCDELIEIWRGDLMFESPHSNNFHRMHPFQWLILLVSWYHSFRILGLQLVQLVWQGMLINNQHMCDNCLDIGKLCIELGILIIIFIQCIICLLIRLFAFINKTMYDEELVIDIFPYCFAHLAS